MKFAFCLYKYFPYGGLQRDFLRIAQECLDRGHSVEVFTSSWEGEMLPGIKLSTLARKGLQNHTRNVNFYKQVQSHLNSRSFDCVVGFNKMPGLDVYYAADTCFVAKAHRQHKRWYRYTPRFRQLADFEKAVFSADLDTKILLLSEQQQQEFIEFYKTPSERFHLLPPVIAKDRVLPDNAPTIREHVRKQWNLSPNDFLLLMIGSGFKTKGLDRLLQGVAHLPEEVKKRVRLFIIGKDHSQSFESLAKKLNIASRVSFLGGQDNVPDFLLAADLLLHPAYNENTGTVLLEALIYGLPVLTTDVCGYAPYVKKANAGVVLSSPFEQQSFNQALYDMLMSSERTQWQRNALQFTQHADLYSMPERAVDFLEAVR